MRRWCPGEILRRGAGVRTCSRARAALPCGGGRMTRGHRGGGCFSRFGGRVVGSDGRVAGRHGTAGAGIERRLRERNARSERQGGKDRQRTLHDRDSPQCLQNRASGSLRVPQSPQVAVSAAAPRPGRSRPRRPRRRRPRHRRSRRRRSRRHHLRPRGRPRRSDWSRALRSRVRRRRRSPRPR